MIVKPCDPEKKSNLLTLATTNDVLTYKLPEGMDWAVVQLDARPVWTATVVLTAEISLTGATYYNFATPVTYTAVGVQATLVVTGIGYLRLRVSTAAAGTDSIEPTVNCGRTN